MLERRFALIRFEALLKRSLIEALDTLGDDLRQSVECAELLEDHANHLLTLSHEISDECKLPPQM